MKLAGKHDSRRRTVTAKAPLAYSSGPPEKVEAMQAKYGREEVATALAAFFADLALKLVLAGVTRLVVAGGETSGAVASALDLGALTVGQEIDPGVPVLLSHGDTSIALALKSGNFGAPDFFVKALERLKAEPARKLRAWRNRCLHVDSPLAPRAT